MHAMITSVTICLISQLCCGVIHFRAKYLSELHICSSFYDISLLCSFRISLKWNIFTVHLSKDCRPLFSNILPLSRPRRKHFLAILFSIYTAEYFASNHLSPCQYLDPLQGQNRQVSRAAVCPSPPPLMMTMRVPRP